MEDNNSPVIAPKPKYTCSICKLGVIIIDGLTIRGCKHADSPIIAHMSAICYGIGGLQDKTEEELNTFGL